MKHNIEKALSLLDQPDRKHEYDQAYFDSLHPIKPSIVYDTYWRFAYLRQNVFYNKLLNDKGTSDPILKTYKFTNVYRATDRVSQYLINNIIYSGKHEGRDLFYRIILFKLFNKIETWEYLERHMGEIRYEKHNFNTIDQLLSQRFAAGHRIYSAAYIMPSGGSVFKNKRKHTNHLMLIEKMIGDKVYEKIRKASTFENVYKILLSYPTIGPFLAYQFSIDLNYSELINFDENDFVVAGPGAISGIAKCFISTGGLSNEEIIAFMQERQKREFERLKLDFQPLGHRMPTLIDCQNVFCEVDKYSRIAHPEIVSAAKRTRIKQKYTPHVSPIEHFGYPPKWGINEEFQNELSA